MDHLPGSVESVEKSGWNEYQIEDHPSGALQPLGHQAKVYPPVFGEMKRLDMKDQKESQKDPGDPLEKPAVSTTLSCFSVHGGCSLKEVCVYSRK